MQLIIVVFVLYKQYFVEEEEEKQTIHFPFTLFSNNCSKNAWDKSTDQGMHSFASLCIFKLVRNVPENYARLDLYSIVG